MIIYLIIIAGLVLVDQITKIIVMRNMEIGFYNGIEIIPNFFHITSARNTGAAWSMLENKMSFFYLITIVALAIFAYFLYKEGDLANKKLHTISLLFIIAGTIGNFIDRIVYKEVVDFLHFMFRGESFPIFNVADVLLTLGTIGFGISIVFFSDK